MLHHLKKKTQKTLFDFILYFFVFTTPLFEVPQAFLIYSHKNAEGVSIYTWGYFALSSVVWLAYGLRRNIKPIVFAYSLYLIIEAVIVFGILKYS